MELKLDSLIYCPFAPQNKIKNSSPQLDMMLLQAESHNWDFHI